MDKTLDDKIKYLNERLVTESEFKELLREINKSDTNNRIHIQFILKDKAGTKYVYGEEGEGTAKETSTIDLEDGYRLSTSLWRGTQILSLDKCIDLFKAFWNDGYCDSVSGLPAADRTAFNEKCENTFNAWQEEGKKVAFFMMDLDHFKEVNTRYDHKAGTDVISEFSRLLFSEIHSSGILIHQSGDEFNLIFPYEYPYEVICIAERIRFKVFGHKFEDAPDISLTMAIGIYLIEQEKMNFMEARRRAEQAYDPDQKNQLKQRDSIRIGKAENYEEYGRDSVRLAFTRIRCNVYADVFHNIYLSYLSYRAAQMAINEESANRLKAILKWINPQWNNSIRCTNASRKWDTKETLSPIETGMSILQGLLKNKSVNNQTLKFIVRMKDDPCIQICVNGTEVFYDKIKGSEQDDINWEMSGVKVYGENVNVKKTILVQSGYHEINVPGDIFYQVVKVDTRPTIGGQLPDFWEATLCELITNMQKNPNFTDILIYGDVENTKKVKMYLKNISEWAEEGDFQYRYIAKKTYKSESDIIAFKNKFIGHVHFCKDEDEIINYIFNQCQMETELIKAESDMSEKRTKRFLERKLSYENIRLGMESGCRARTIAEAFPTVLEILRNSLGHDSEASIVDQAGRRLRELIDFRILLEKPKNDIYPEYYLDDKKELDEYYEESFGKKDALFRKAFEMNGQLEAMLNHICTAVQNGEKAYATRRAILIVPSQMNMENSSDYSPLGLVSVWTAPRTIKGKIIIDYSYTWRTVEALVGLPHSLYASVRFADYLTDQIAEKVHKRENTVVEMGRISYIAHSLHMFLDPESMSIVRGIVNEASI